MMNIQHPFHMVTSRSWSLLTSLGALITTVGGVISYKLIVGFSLQVKLASLILFVKGVAPYVFLFVVYGLDQIGHIFLSEVISLINGILSNNLWANCVLVIGFILLLIDFKAIRVASLNYGSWSRSGIYDRSRILLMILLVIYIVWGLLVIFMNKLANANFLSSILFLWSHVVSVYLLTILGKLNMKRFWLYVSIVKFITFIVIAGLNFFTSLETVYPLIGWSTELVGFYTLNIMNLSEWEPIKWFLFLIPCSQLFVPFTGAYHAVGLGIAFSSSKLGSFGIELDMAIKDGFNKRPYQFQSMMLFGEYVSAGKKGNPLGSILSLSEGDLKTQILEYNSKMRTTHRPQWAIKDYDAFIKKISCLEKIFSKANQADKDIKLSLTGKGQAAFNHYKFCDQNSGFTVGINPDLWASFLRGSSYGKLLIPHGLSATHPAPWSYTFMDTAYYPSTQSSNQEKIFQLVRESDTAALFMQQVKVDGLERPVLNGYGDAIIRIKDTVIYADFKALTIQPQYSTKWNTVPNSTEQKELLKQFSERVRDVEIYFEKEHIKNAMALILANKMIAPSELVELNSSMYGKSTFLSAEKRHTIVAFSSEEE